MVRQTGVVTDGVVMLIRRCAWCARVFTPDGWVTLDRPAEPADRETATICPDCVEGLKARGLSR